MAFPTPSNWFRNSILEILTAGATATRRADLNADTFKCALYAQDASGTAANFDTDIGYGTGSWSTARTEHGATGGYTAGGATCATPTVTVSGGVLIFDAGDAVWAASTISAVGGLLYDDTLTAGNKLGLVTVDFGQVLQSNNGEFRVKWSDSPLGILRIS